MENSLRADSRMISRLFLRLLPVQILLALIGAVNGMISGTLASNYIGSAAMSAIGLFGPLNMVITVISTVMLGGSQILCGKFMGRGQRDRTQDLFSLVMASTLVVGAVLTAVFLTLSTPLANLLGANDETRTHLSQYIVGSGVGVIPMILGQQAAGFLTLENGRRRTSAASIVYVAVNAGLNFLFVGPLRLEAFGLALGNSLGYWVFLAILLQYYLTKKAVLKLRLTRMRWGDLLEVVKIGMPGALTNAYQVVRGFLFNSILLSALGNDAIAAFTAFNTVGGIAWAMPAGVIAVGRLLVSVAVGEEDRQSLKDIMRTALLKGCGLVALVYLVLTVLAVPLTELFYHDPAAPVYRLTVAVFRTYSLSMVLSTAVVLFINCAQAVGRPVLVQLLALGDGLVNIVVFCWLFVPVLGIYGATLSNVYNGLVNLAIVAVFSWVVNRRFPRSMDDLLALKPGFGVPPDRRMDLTLHRREEAVLTARKVQEFCQAHHVEPRRGYFAGLCMEEMAVNVLDHGFEKDRKKHTVDVRVVLKDEELILRLKDDCVPFDPEERRVMAVPEDPVKNVGIRLVYGIARDVTYQNMLGLNVLTIQV